MRKFNADQTTSIVAGNGNAGCAADGPAPAALAELTDATSVCLDAVGNRLFITEQGCHRLRVLDLETGAISTAVGNTVSGGRPGGSCTGGVRVHMQWRGRMAAARISACT